MAKVRNEPLFLLAESKIEEMLHAGTKNLGTLQLELGFVGEEGFEQFF